MLAGSVTDAPDLSAIFFALVDAVSPLVDSECLAADALHGRMDTPLLDLVEVVARSKLRFGLDKSSLFVNWIIHGQRDRASWMRVCRPVHTSSF